MAEETAGIGNAAALITRAKPQDFGIVRGLKMAESSALAKAKMEAAAAAKKQAKLDKMSRYMTMVDRMKEPYTQRKANNESAQAFLEVQEAAETGDMQKAAQAEYNYKTKIPFIKQEDENLSLLNPKNNKEGIDTTLLKRELKGIHRYGCRWNERLIKAKTERSTRLTHRDWLRTGTCVYCNG